MDSCYDEVGQQKGVVNIALLPGRVDDLPEPIFRFMDHFSRMEKVRSFFWFPCLLLLFPGFHMLLPVTVMQLQ